MNLENSVNTLFVFMIFSSIAFGISTVLMFGMLYIYHKMYASSWYDPIWDTLANIAREENELEKQAERKLFQ
jgi:hypothetical protein